MAKTFDPLVIEAQLAHAVKDANGRRISANTILCRLKQLTHAVKDANGRAYNRTTYMQHRAGMMQAWADHLDKLAKGADVVPFRA